jgi:tetratricopeptide (TPR) repeat protein
MKNQLKVIVLLIMTVFVALVSCKKETIVRNEILIEPPSSEFTMVNKEQRITENGWKLFSMHEYEQALDSFQLAVQVNSLYPDAYNGMGWAYAQLDSMEKSHHHFTICIVSTAVEQIHKDACAGRAFVNLAMGEYEKAILDVDAVIYVPGYYYDYYDDYAFRHEPSFSKNKLLLVKAESYFMMGDYNSCWYALWHIDENIEENADPEALAIIIEELKSAY